MRHDCFVLGHKSSPYPSTLLVSFPNNAVPCLGKLAYVVHSPIQQVGICTQLVCRLPAHKKKKSTATLVYVHCSPKFLCNGVEHPCTVESPLLLCMSFLTVETPAVAIITRAVLFLVPWLMRAQAWLIPHLDRTVLSTQELCPRPPS